MEGVDITKVSNVVYLDKGGNPVEGYRVEFVLTMVNEVFFVNVPDLDENEVNSAIADIAAKRLRLMGG